MTKRTDAGMLLVAISLCAAPTLAEPRLELPAPLAPWVSWVLADVPDHGCAFEGDRALCRWPGKLALDLGAQGGRFEQHVLLDRSGGAALPGSRARWPLSVRVDGRAIAVLDQDGVPSVQIPAGMHRIEGRFEWRTLPERLELPALLASVALRANGKSVALPKRDEQGQLWLQGGPTSAPQNEQLGVSVTRKLEDAVPFITTTRIKLRVSGPAREVSLGQVLLLGTTPLSLQSELPARLEEGGELRLQVRAGSYSVELRARSDAPPEQLAFRSASPLWPKSEVWVWQADEALRQVQLSGAPAVEPSRTELDADWRNLPAFSVREGMALKFATMRRGEPSPPPNRLTLERELWLDLDGGGYTVRDRISTELQQGFRLELLAGQLGHVSSDGEDLLITQTHAGKHAGVELRKQKQALLAEWRYGRQSVLPAVAWSEDVQSLSATLHLGPGFRLLAARGVDSVSETWLQAWDLFDFFFVLLVAIAVGRLIGRAYALLALVALALCHGEEGAPQATWFALLALVALLRVLPAGWFRNLVRVGFALSVATLLVIAVPFVVEQVRVAIYPQLAQSWTAWTPVAASFNAMPTAPPQASPDVEGRGDSGAAGAAFPSRPDGLQPLAPRALQQDPEATVQTGPGVPSWSFRSWTLRWSGPVDKAHEIELYLLSPGENRALGLLRVVLLTALLIALVRAATPGRERPVRASAATSTAMLLAGLAGLGSWLVAPPAHADLPDQALLDKLRERLVKPADCRPNCVSIDELRIAIDDAGLVLSLSVHAGDRTSVRLPGPAASFVPAEVTLDHHPDAPMVLLDDGFLHVRVEPGVHLIEARGPLPASDTLTLSFGDRPHRARAQAVGWKVDGVREDGSVEAALQLSRVLSVAADKALESAALPPFLALERQIELGPSWEVHSTLRRVSPTGAPIVVRVPLLAGESVIESSLEVEGGELHVAFGRDESVIEWRSRLKPSDRIELRAAQGRPWSERWRLLCGPIWRCEVQGLTPVLHVQAGRWQPELVPWPGEAASIVVSRPEPAAGQSLTIDAADLELTPGARMQKASLELRVRSSRGATQVLTLPAGARVQQLAIDGQERSVHAEGRALAITLGPGTHALRLQWQQRTGMETVQRGPELQLGHAAANASVRVHVPDDRWLLWLSGPSWGPAILFWGYLLVVLGAALALGRMRYSPLRAHQWMLLGLGLTQIPVQAALCIVSWFFVMAYRARMPEQPRWLHNSTQLVLVGWTLTALGCLYLAVQTGLLVRPDMQVMGANSNGTLLRWYLDRIEGAMPAPTIVSVPLWVWRLSMLAWSLWLAGRLVGWLPWAFACFKQGALWKRNPPAAPRVGPLPSPGEVK